MVCKYLVVIPLYNHAGSIAGVIADICAVCGSQQPCAPVSTILVVDDGSTDGGGEVVEQLAAESDEAHGQIKVELLCQKSNQGKGAAILLAAAWAADHMFTHIITLDADGQHSATDIPALLHESTVRPQAFIVGARDFSVNNIPGASRFGRSFSGFWMRVQTGVKVSDMQSGFRIYPIAPLRGLKLREKRFAFEMEVLVKAVWSGFAVYSYPVQVYYPPKEERVSHFHKFYDNLRISLMNTKLTVRALIPLPFLKREQDEQGRISVLRPLESIRRLLCQKNTPLKLGFSTGVAILVNLLPLIGLQSIITLLAIGWFRLHRVWTLSVHHALWPPILIPFCIEGGYLLRHGRFLTEISWSTMIEQAHLRLLEWVLGGVVFGPLLALFGGWLVYAVALQIGRHLPRQEREA
jgi:glycosyltransferase involved in cell wall biosynthesis